MYKRKKILFFVESTFNQRDYKRFGFEILRARGFEVIVWDFTPLLRKKFYNFSIPSDSSSIKYKYHEIIADKSDFYRLSLQLNNNIIAIMLFGLRANTKFIFDQLVNNQVLFGFCQLGLIPTRPRKLIEKIFSLIENPKLLLSKSRSFFQIGVNNSIYSNFIITGGRGASQYNKYPKNNHTKIIKTHTLDYDLYINDKSKGSVPIVHDKYAVFLDEFVPFHPDYLHMDIKPDCSFEDYYPDINRMFNKVESEYNLKVVIAAHPSSDYNKKENPFNKRICIRDETINLVKYSDLVIIHASTAINFAILYNKPILFITSHKYSSRFNKIIQFTSSVFRKTAINIGKSSLDFDLDMKVDKSLYKSYKERFIKAPGTPEKTVWDIFADNIS